MRLPLRSPWSRLAPGLRASLLMLTAALAFSSMHAMIRYLTTDIHPFQVAFFRIFFGLLALMPLIARSGLTVLRTSRPWLHGTRALLQTASMLMFFSALQVAPLARVSALSFTAPLFATLGAVAVLGERIHSRRMIALAAGFAGAMVVAAPGAGLDRGALLVLMSSSGWAAALLIIKVISRTDSAVTLAVYMNLLMTPMSFVPALLVWRWPDPGDYVWLVVMGITGTVGHLAIAQAFKEADATALMPIDFTRLIWASVLGFVLFREVPELRTWIGGLAIFGSTTFIAYRESRRKEGEPSSGSR